MVLLISVIYALVAAMTATASLLPHSRSHHSGRRLVPDIVKHIPGTPFKHPVHDSFYHVPKNISKYPLGAIIHSRKGNATAFGTMAAEAYQILYRTTNHNGSADATAATIVVPVAPRPGTPKALAIGSAEDSANINCNPSFAFAQPDVSRNYELVQIFDAPVATAALFRGWYVVIPDALGSNSEFLVGLTEGRAFLDGIRASRNFADYLHKADFAITGYSGGGHTVGWAAQEAETYYPDAPIVGMVTGGVPADTNNTFFTLNGGDYSALGYMGAVAMSRAHPDVHHLFNERFTKAGRQNFTKIMNGEWCELQGQDAVSNVRIQTAFTGGDMFKEPVVMKHMEDEKLGAKVNRIPSKYLHSRNDQIVPWPQMVNYITQQCQQGAKLQLSWVTATGHISSGLRLMPQMFEDLVLMLEQGQKVTTCGIDPQGLAFMPTYANNTLDDLLGREARNLLAYWDNQVATGQFKY